MSTAYMLVCAKPGRVGEVLRRLDGVPGVKDHEILFGEQIAARVDFAGVSLEQAASTLKAIDGILESRMYVGKRCHLLVRPARFYPTGRSSTN
ncbi:MAG: hypothetical protein HY556_11360 [Euryarchaeota archaeon]|nr:hypothetical protein [Euryarchaeota archaeon]